ncbi:MAG: hypothetical protein WBM54_04605 [Woeseia sp.]
MDYRGPQTADFQNIEVLNAGFIGLLHGNPGRASALLAGLPEVLQQRLLGLSVLQRERLAKTPFLLFSFREADSQYWEQLFGAGPVGCLFDKAPAPGIKETELLAAALGFLWQLARDNAYAARLVCSASLHWCELLAERPLLEVIATAARADVIRLRHKSDAKLWRKLLYAGVAGEPAIRRAARVCALQTLLTENTQAQPARAARHMRQTLKVAESNEP